MKRFIAVILAFIYISTAIGANVQLHYCMGKLTEWKLGSSDEARCNVKACGMKRMAAGKHAPQKSSTTKKKCCEDEYKELKLKKDQRAAESVQLAAFMAFEATPVVTYTLPVVQVVSLATAFPVSGAPPGAADVPVFLLNCNFRI